MFNSVYIATSLDGYIAREDGSIDWLIELPNPGKSDYGFSDFLDRVDGIIMGRKTFEIVVEFKEWPYVRPIPVFVLSDSLSELPCNLPVNVEIISGELKNILAKLAARGICNLYVDGGKTIQGFLKEDLIDEMIITKIPVLLGAGISLFGGNNLELKFEHIETIVYNNMLVRSKYYRKK